MGVGETVILLCSAAAKDHGRVLFPVAVYWPLLEVQTLLAFSCASASSKQATVGRIFPMIPSALATFEEMLVEEKVRRWTWQ